MSGVLTFLAGLALGYAAAVIVRELRSIGDDEEVQR